MPKTVAVIGASSDRSHYSNKAVRAYRQEGWEVHPVNPNEDTVEGLQVVDTIGDVSQPIDRVTVYVNPKTGKSLLDDIAATGPGEVFFNPGAEDPELLKRAKDLGLNVKAECSITNLGLSPSQFPDE